MSCRWCPDGSCLLCQIGDSVAALDETGGLSSPAGHMREVHEVSDVVPDRTLDDDRSYSLAHACPICGARFKDMFIHYRKKHPTVSVPALYKQQTKRGRDVKGCLSDSGAT